MFHVCSHGSRDARRGEEPWLEGAYALRQRLPAGNAIHAEVRLPQAMRRWGGGGEEDRLADSHIVDSPQAAPHATTGAHHYGHWRVPTSLCI